jgi:hypothetical protein
VLPASVYTCYFDGSLNTQHYIKQANTMYFSISVVTRSTVSSLTKDCQFLRRTKILGHCFSNLRHLLAPFGISALSTYPLSLLYQNKLTRIWSNRIIIKPEGRTKRKICELGRRCGCTSMKRFSFLNNLN